MDCAQVLECAPLRDAVYRNRTPDRGLRHAVSLGCLPFRSFAAVAPWLPPWAIVPPAEACAKVESLEINARHHRDADYLRVLASVAAAVSELRCTPATSETDAPFAKVRSLSLSFNLLTYSPTIADNTRKRDEAVARILQSLPALQSFHVNGFHSATYRSCGNHTWLLLNAAPLQLLGPTSELVGDAAIATFRRLPKLTSIAVRGPARSAFFQSVLLCRGTLKTIAWDSTVVIDNLITPAGNKAASPTDDLHVRLSSEAPRYADPSVVPLDADGRVAVQGLPLVPVHWTLETLVLQCRWGSLLFDTLQLLILMAPRLRSATIQVDPLVNRNVSPVGRWAATRSCLHSQAVEVLLDDRSTIDRALFENLTEEQMEVVAVAHRTVQTVMEAYEADRGALPRSMLQHSPALDRVVADGSYPAALLWAFSRGLEHTVLTALDLRRTLTDEDAAEAVAVVALARHLRPKKGNQS